MDKSKTIELDIVIKCVSKHIDLELKFSLCEEVDKKSQSTSDSES